VKTIITILLIGFFSIVFSQIMSEADIKEFAVLINDQLQGMDLGNGVTFRHCLAIGRTFIYQYDVNEYWYPTENMKEDLIGNSIEAGNADLFYKNDINVEQYYFFENKLLKKISIKSREFSNLNFELGDYLSIKGHPKAKGVDLIIKAPIGWKIEEGGLPNIVKKFVYGNNSYGILIKDNVTFVSRNEFREIFKDANYVNEFILNENSSIKNLKILNHDIVTIDSYPFLLYTIKGQMERSGIEFSLVIKCWVTYYEDKMICLSGGGPDNMEFYHLEGLYNKITNSLIFPEQYNW